MKKLIGKITDLFILKIVPIFKWRLRGRVGTEQLATIDQMLRKDYYIILTRRRNHLSAHLTSLGHFLLTGKWGYWSHVLMNTEDEVGTRADFRLVEAIKDGTVYSPFEEVFNVNAVCLMKPRTMSIDEWTAALDHVHTLVGRPYDTLFDLKNDNKLSCVELVRAALMVTPNYKENFAQFESMIASEKNLTPQMFFDCPDFEVVYEIRN